MSTTLLDELKTLGLVLSVQFSNRQTGRNDPRDVVLYDGLLYAAKQVGLTSIQTELVQTPSETNGWTAIARARVELKSGVFTGIGDATPENVNPRIRPAYIRMAETRAKARALRDAVDLRGVVAYEELDDTDRAESPEARQESRAAEPRAAHEPTRAAPEPARPVQRPAIPIVHSTPAGRATPAQPRAFEGGEVRVMSEKQRAYLFRLMREAEGLTGEDAASELCRRLGVEDLEAVPARSASTLIDQLSGNGNGNGNRAGSKVA